MPRGKERRAVTTEPTESEIPQEPDEPATEEPSAAEELTSSPVEEQEQEPAAKPRRQWNPLRRKKSEPEAVATEEAAAEEAATEAQAEAEAPDTDAPTAEAEVPTEESTADGLPVDEAEGETTESVEEAAAEEPILVPHRPAGKRLKIVAAAASVLFVAGAAFAAATAQPVIANRALVETKLDIARTAQSAITTLWSYTPDNMDSLADRSAGYLTGDFATQYRKFIDSIVATNKQAQVTNTTNVLGTAVESVSGSEATALVYTNSVATSPVSKNIPSLRYLSYRLEMKRERSDWRITRMTTITTLDLTPQL
jgi:Mce-associated membrane protein